MLIEYVIILFITLYFILLRFYIAKYFRKRLGKKIIFLGRCSNSIIVMSITGFLVTLIEILQMFVLDKIPFEVIHLYTIVISLLIIGIYFYVGIKKSYIYENGISTSLISLEWTKINKIEWYYGINNDRIRGLKIYSKKNIFTNISGFNILKINKNNEEKIKEYIENNYKEKIDK